MAANKTVQHACQVLRARVRYRQASLRLPDSEFPQNDTPKIREATALYVESWIVPLLDAIETGDMRLLDSLTKGNSDRDKIGLPIDRDNGADEPTTEKK